MSRVALAIVSAEKLDAAKVVETRPEDTAAFHAAIADYIARNFDPIASAESFFAIIFHKGLKAAFRV